MAMHRTTSASETRGPRQRGASSKRHWRTQLFATRYPIFRARYDSTFGTDGHRGKRRSDAPGRSRPHGRLPRLNTAQSRPGPSSKRRSSRLSGPSHDVRICASSNARRAASCGIGQAPVQDAAAGSPTGGTRSPVRSYSKDGAMRVENVTDPVYYPNSVQGRRRPTPTPMPSTRRGWRTARWCEPLTPCTPTTTTRARRTR